MTSINDATNWNGGQVLTSQRPHLDKEDSQMSRCHTLAPSGGSTFARTGKSPFCCDIFTTIASSARCTPVCTSALGGCQLHVDTSVPEPLMSHPLHSNGRSRGTSTTSRLLGSVSQFRNLLKNVNWSVKPKMKSRQNARRTLGATLVRVQVSRSLSHFGTQKCFSTSS